LYDIKDRKPLVFLCGHTFCKQCISQNYLKNKEITCFNRCYFKGHIYKSTDEVGVNIEILSQVENSLKIPSKKAVEEDKNDKQCLLHPPKILDVFCVTDNIAICSECWVKSHKGHDVITEEEKIERDIKEEIERIR